MPSSYFCHACGLAFGVGMWDHYSEEHAKDYVAVTCFICADCGNLCAIKYGFRKNEDAQEFTYFLDVCVQPEPLTLTEQEIRTNHGFVPLHLETWGVYQHPDNPNSVYENLSLDDINEWRTGLKCVRCKGTKFVGETGDHIVCPRCHQDALQLIANWIT